MPQQDWDELAQRIITGLTRLPEGIRKFFLRELRIASPAMFESVQAIRRQEFELLRKFI